MTSSNNTICRGCKEEKPISAHGLCSACYNRVLAHWKKDGQLDTFKDYIEGILAVGAIPDHRNQPEPRYCICGGAITQTNESEPECEECQQGYYPGGGLTKDDLKRYGARR